ncbi:unnamed protein product [Cunninghamella blakesleeana]
MTNSTSNRVFVIGGTGNVGTKATRDLLNNNVPVTLYARQPSKANDLFPDYINGDLLTVVQGDLKDLTTLKKALLGHTRLFLLITDFNQLTELKVSIAKYAYEEAGIQQILDISGISVSYPWRTNSIAYIHYVAEKKIVELAEQEPKKRSYVALRPGRYMSNLITFDRPTEKGIFDTPLPDEPQGWISPNDIGAVAAVVLREDISKHGNAVYELIGDVVTPKRRAELFTEILDNGHTYTFQQITSLVKFQRLAPMLSIFPFTAVYDLCTDRESHAYVTPGIPILLGRDPETLEQFIKNNKNAFLNESN